MTTKPVVTFREGAIGLSVWQHEGKNGPFFDLTLSRCFQGSEGKFGYSNSFNESNTEAMVTVIQQAAAWIREHRQAAGIPATQQGRDLLDRLQEAYE